MLGRSCENRGAVIGSDGRVFGAFMRGSPTQPNTPADRHKAAGATERLAKWHEVVGSDNGPERVENAMVYAEPVVGPSAELRRRREECGLGYSFRAARWGTAFVHRAATRKALPYETTAQNYVRTKSRALTGMQYKHKNAFFLEEPLALGCCCDAGSSADRLKGTGGCDGADGE